MPSYKLIYFDTTGRAEVTRILFSVAGIPFRDERINFNQLNKLREERCNPYQTLPILEITEKGKDEKFILDQSMAINRHLARQFGLDGDTSTDKAKVDEIMEYVNDMMNAYLVFIDAPETVKKLYEEKAKKAFNKTCTYLEKVIQSNIKKGKGFAVGGKLSYADVHIFAAFEFLLDKHDPNLLQHYPNIRKCREKVSNFPKVNEWLWKREIMKK